MDESILRQRLQETSIEDWEILSTGEGFLLVTDWHWPNNERIEIHIRPVGERDDLYLVSDGGDLFNLLYSQGVELGKDERGMKILDGVAKNYGAKVVDCQIAKGAGPEDLHRAIRMVLEAVKDASFLLWYKLDEGACLH